VNLSETVQGRTSYRPRHQQLARVLRVPGRFLPLAAHLEDLRAVEEALAPIAHEIGLRRAPPRKPRGPLVRTTQIENLLASLQHGAVGIAREYRRHVSGNHRDHRLIEQGDTLGDASETDQRAPAALSGLACEIAISILARDLRGLIEEGVSGGCITLHDALNGGCYQ
jgi:hypothetical protein